MGMKVGGRPTRYGLGLVLGGTRAFDLGSSEGSETSSFASRSFHRIPGRWSE